MIYEIVLYENYIHDAWEDDWYKCPNCNFDSISHMFNYCPNCGESLCFIESKESED